MKHPSVLKADTDDQYYLEEDLEWYVQPSLEDPGVLGPKQGAHPRDRETGEILGQHQYELRKILNSLR